MAINSISTQQVSGNFPQCGRIRQRGRVDERVERHQRSGEQGHHTCGATVTEGAAGAPPGFTPYHDHNSNKMVYLESRSASGVVPICRLNSEQPRLLQKGH